MHTLTPVTGHVGGECYLLVSDRSTLLLDTGFSFCAGKTIDNIRAVLGERPLDYILASHSHYDHISAAPAIKRVYPGAKLVGSDYAARVVAKDSARELMRSLNADCARDAGLPLPPDYLDELALDVILKDGEALRLPDATVRALETPGHTRCCMSYHLLEQDLLMCSETAGVAPQYPDVVPTMIVGYTSALESIERLRLLGARQVFVAHFGIIPEGDSEVFFRNARLAVEKAVDMLLGMHDRGCGEEEIVAAFVREFYLPSSGIQPERAFIINTRALIPRILKEAGRID